MTIERGSKAMRKIENMKNCKNNFFQFINRFTEVNLKRLCESN